MLDRMTWFLAVASLTQSEVVGLRRPAMASRGILPRMKRIAVVCVHHVTCRASARAVVTRVIVSSKERKHRIEQPRLLEPEKHRVGSQKRSKSSRAEEVLRRFARRFFGKR